MSATTTSRATTIRTARNQAGRRRGGEICRIYPVKSRALRQAIPGPQREARREGKPQSPSGRGSIIRFVPMALWDSSYNLLKLPRPLLVRREPLGRWREPKLAVPWGSFRQSLASSLGALVRRPVAPRAFLAGPYFRDCWVQRRVPTRAVLAAALWHLVFLVAPDPNFLSAAGSERSGV